MKMLFIWLAVLAATCSLYATEYQWVNLHATNYTVNDVYWNTVSNWAQNSGYPNTPQDVAVFTNLPLPSRALLTVYLPQPSVVTVGVMRMEDAVYRTYIQRSWGTRSFRFERDGGTPLIYVNQLGNTGSLEIVNMTSIEFPAGLDVVVTNWPGGISSGVQLLSPLVGSAPINKHGDGMLQVNNQSPVYSGTVTVYQGSLFAGAAALSNAAVVVTDGTQYIDALSRNTNFTALVLRGGTVLGEAVHYGAVLVDGAGVLRPNYSQRYEYGVISGHGTISAPAAGFTLALCGRLAPGMTPGAVGTLSFSIGGGVQFLVGLTDAFATLEIDIVDTNGIAGADHDLIEFSAYSVFSPSTANLIVRGVGGPDVTNWFLTTSTSYSNDATFASVTFVDGEGEVIYDTAEKRIGVIVVPEPACCLACVAWLALRRRMTVRIHST